MSGTKVAEMTPSVRTRSLRRTAAVAAAGALACVSALGSPPASGGVGEGPALSIDPTSGPIGTTITATVTGCLPLNPDGEARLDFAFVEFTPSNTVFFEPDAEGDAIVQIEALDKEGTAGETDAEVIVSQCEAGGAMQNSVGAAGVDEGTASAPFTVIRQTAPPTTPTDPAATAPAVVATPAFTG